MGKIKKGLRDLTIPDKKEVNKEVIFAFIIIVIFIGVIYFGDKLGIEIVKEIFNKRL